MAKQDRPRPRAKVRSRHSIPIEAEALPGGLTPKEFSEAMRSITGHSSYYEGQEADEAEARWQRLCQTPRVEW